mmetsp:Transcript_3742/g.12608  ORF Transcript_3742/g.12608 Transcript_3742/m.12608 type:complete len:205 (-) Transcript_3742:177-791(-)
MPIQKRRRGVPRVSTTSLPAPNAEWSRRRTTRTRRRTRTRTRARSPPRRSRARGAGKRMKSRWTIPSSGRSSCPKRRRRKGFENRKWLRRKPRDWRRRKKRTPVVPEAAPWWRNANFSGPGRNAKASSTSSACSGLDSGAPCTPHRNLMMTKPPRTSRRFADAMSSRLRVLLAPTRALSFWTRRAPRRRGTSWRFPRTKAARSP